MNNNQSSIVLPIAYKISLTILILFLVIEHIGTVSIFRYRISSVDKLIILVQIIFTIIALYYLLFCVAAIRLINGKLYLFRLIGWQEITYSQIRSVELASRFSPYLILRMKRFNLLRMVIVPVFKNQGCDMEKYIKAMIIKGS